MPSGSYIDKEVYLRQDWRDVIGPTAWWPAGTPDDSFVKNTSLSKRVVEDQQQRCSELSEKVARQRHVTIDGMYGATVGWRGSLESTRKQVRSVRHERIFM
jgi:hypothetical protein